MDAVRKAYHRAVQIPMDNVKKLWEEYQDFENGLNKITVSSCLSNTGFSWVRSSSSEGSKSGARCGFHVQWIDSSPTDLVVCFRMCLCCLT